MSWKLHRGCYIHGSYIHGCYIIKCKKLGNNCAKSLVLTFNLLFNKSWELREHSSTWLNQAGKIVLTSSPFAHCQAPNGTLFDITDAWLLFRELQFLSTRCFAVEVSLFMSTVNLEISTYRMENTQICEQIIQDFNGKKIQGTMSTYVWYFACYILLDYCFQCKSSPVNSQV